MNKKIIVIYISKTGFTQQYAYDIAVDLHAEMVSWDRFDFDMIKQFDVVIFGSRIVAGQIDKINAIKFYVKDNPDIDFILYVTGAAPDTATKEIDKIWKENLTFMNETLPHFYLQSGLKYDQMNIIERNLVKAFAKFLKMKPHQKEETLKQAELMSDSFDHSSIEKTVPLIDYVKELTDSN